MPAGVIGKPADGFLGLTQGLFCFPHLQEALGEDQSGIPVPWRCGQNLLAGAHRIPEVKLDVQVAEPLAQHALGLEQESPGQHRRYLDGVREACAPSVQEVYGVVVALGQSHAAACGHHPFRVSREGFYQL